MNNLHKCASGIISLNKKKKLPPHFHSTAGSNDQLFIDATDIWRERSGGMQLPQLAITQKAWDMTLVGIAMDKVLSAAPNQAGIARLTAASAPYSRVIPAGTSMFLDLHTTGQCVRSESPSQLDLEPQYIQFWSPSMRSSHLHLWSNCGIIRYSRT